MLKIGIVGSRQFLDRSVIHDFITELISVHGTDITIISGGCNTGADFIAKTSALKHGVKYTEFPPFHDAHNEYCSLPPELFGLPHSNGYYHQRNKLIAEHSDIIVGFVPKGILSRGTNSTLSFAHTLNKPTLKTDGKTYYENRNSFSTHLIRKLDL